MFLKKLEVQAMAQGLARHAAAAQAVTAGNIANADTPGYRATRMRSFAEVWDSGAQGLKATRARHFGGGRLVEVRAEDRDLQDSPNKNSVSLEAELMQSALNRQSHDMALGVSHSFSGVLRQTLSRR